MKMDLISVINKIAITTR